jgi:hypothetical protein
MPANPGLSRAPYPKRCFRCAQTLVDRVKRCPACGFPTRDSALLLVISEMPTSPSRSPQRSLRQTRSLEHIDEIDTLPQRNEIPSRALIPARLEPPALTIDAASWRRTSSAVGYTGNSRFRNARVSRRSRRRSDNFHALDRLRWWLLYPGRMEFLGWLGSLILLFMIICFLLLVIILNGLLPGRQSRGNLPNSTVVSSARRTHSQTPLSITITAAPTPVVAGTPFTPAVSATVTQKTGPSSSGVGNALHPSDDTSLPGRVAHLAPLVWLIAACYFFSILLLLLAVFLRRRQHARET